MTACAVLASSGDGVTPHGRASTQTQRTPAAETAVAATAVGPPPPWWRPLPNRTGCCPRVGSPKLGSQRGRGPHRDLNEQRPPGVTGGADRASLAADAPTKGAQKKRRASGGRPVWPGADATAACPCLSPMHQQACSGRAPAIAGRPGARLG